MLESFLHFDWSVFSLVDKLFHPGSNAFFDTFFAWITKLGDSGIFWIVLGLVFCLFRKTRKAGAVVLAALVLDVALTNGLLKNVFARPRPYDSPNADFADAFRSYFDFIGAGKVEKPNDFSFPSGHTAASFAGAIAGMFAVYGKPAIQKLKPFTWILLVLAILIGFSRIYLGVHYATDVLFGALIGTVCAAAAYVLFKLFQKWFDKLDGKINAFVDRHFTFYKKKKEN